MIELFSLGEIYPSDFLKPDEQPRCEPVELKLVMEDNGLVHLEKTAPKECMWGERYWYKSSISGLMRMQLKDIVESIVNVFDVKTNMLWIDVAGNDGYLLSQTPADCIRINIDPANDSFKSEAEKNSDLVIQDYFSAEVFKKSQYGDKKAGIISCISMFYDLTDPDSFLDDIYEILDDNGLLCLQLSYSPLMLLQLEFSNICHEHYAYYSLNNIKPLLDRHRFKIMDVSLNNTNAGSFRIFAMKFGGDVTKFGSQTYRDVCRFRTDSLIHYENFGGFYQPEAWMAFFDRVNSLAKQTVDFIISEKEKGKIIMGYGASTKFNTTLQYFGLSNELVTAIADRSQAKHGLRTVGSNIPIISEEDMRLEKPDYLLVGPAHFISEFMERESALLKTGTKFIVTMPSFQIISA